MIRRISELADALLGEPLLCDEIADDVDNASAALQALTMIVAAREARKAVSRWVQNGVGRLRLVPDNPPTPEEVAEDDRRRAEMVAEGRGPAARIFDSGSTTLRNTDGSPITSFSQYEKAKKTAGVVEVAGYDVRNSDALVQKAEVEKRQKAEFAALVEKAIEFGKQTGQITSDMKVPAGMPVTPLPVDKREPLPKRPEPVAEDTQHPMIETIPFEKRRRVNTDAMAADLVGKALKNATERAYAGGNGALV